MLILKFNNEYNEVENKKRARLFVPKSRKQKNDTLNRYSVIVNGKNISVLELTRKELKSDDVQMLLKIYKGRVLTSEKYKNDDELKEHLYSPKLYYQRALISSLVNQIKAANKEWKNICIKTDSFEPFKELYELVIITKRVSIITEESAYTRAFIKDCYYKYGAIVSVKGDASIIENDVFVNLNEIDNGGRVMINVNSKDFILYPDARYFESCDEYQKLLPFGLEYNIICSVFSEK